jgi:hypothetical protein
MSLALHHMFFVVLAIVWVAQNSSAQVALVSCRLCSTLAASQLSRKLHTTQFLATWWGHHPNIKATWGKLWEIKDLFGLTVAVKKAVVSCEKSCSELWAIRKLKDVWLETTVNMYKAIKWSNFGIISSQHSLKFDLVFIIFFPDFYEYSKKSN